MDRIFTENVVSTRRNTPLSWWRILLLVIGGGIVGAVSGLFGGGGGTLVIPLMATIGGLEDKRAHATSLAVILPLAIVSAVVYFVMGTRPDYSISTMVVIGVFLGGLVGTFLLGALKVNTLKIAFYIIMIVAGVRMLVS